MRKVMEVSVFITILILVMIGFVAIVFFICDARIRGVELPGWVVIFGIMSTITFDIVFIFNVCYIWDLIWGEKKEEQKNNTSTYKF